MPGAGKQPAEVQEHIKELLEAGFDPTTIHRKLKVGRSSIYRMKRCLQQHGTAYMPTELNKKNGRPKVLSAEQELEVRDWLRKPDNRTRYLDDLVWLIHDRFGIVCSTTTMSKMKRKWLRVIEYEETGQPLDETTRAALLETHPNLPILHDENAMPLPQSAGYGDVDVDGDLNAESYLESTPVSAGMMHVPQAVMHHSIHGHPQHNNAFAPQIDSQLEQQIQQDMANANVPM